MESPLFIPKKKKSVPDLHQPEEGEKQITYSGQNEPYENVIISPYNAKFYTPRPLHLGSVNGMSHQYKSLSHQQVPNHQQAVKHQRYSNSNQQIQLINQQDMNQHGLDQQVANQHVLNHQPMNHQIINQQPMNHQIINQQPMNLQVINQQPNNQQIMNQQIPNYQEANQVIYPPITRSNSGGKRQQEPYENMDHMQYAGYYPRRQLVRYVPQRTAPQPPLPPSRGRSPGQADTSGYSSYEQNTLSLNRGPGSPPPSLLPTMCEEIDLQVQAFIQPPVIPGYNHPTLPDHPTLTSYHHPTLLSHQPNTLLSHQPNTLDRSHHKFMMDQSVLRQYFCIALSTCIMCPPCGYWSLYQAFKVDDMIDRDNFLGAERLASKIKRYSIIIMVVGVFWVSLTVAVFFLLLNKFKD